MLENQPNAIEEELFGGAIAVYPNPSSGYVTLQLPAPQAGKTKVTLSDISGRKISTHKIAEGQTSITVGNQMLLPCIYLVQLKHPNSGTVAKRFLKK